MGIWLKKEEYNSRFQTPEDVMHLLLEVFQLMTTATAVLHIRPVAYMSDAIHNPEMFLFCAASWVYSVSSLFQYFEIRFWGVDGQDCSKYEAMTAIIGEMPSFVFITAATLYVAVQRFYYGYGFAEDHRILAEVTNDYQSSENKSFQHLPIILMLCSWIIKQITFLPIRFLRGGKDFKKVTVPVNVDFLIHRFGEWSMLMLGTFFIFA